MRAKIAGAFFLGCAVGVLALAVTLWSTGGLRTSALRLQEKPLPPVPGGFDLSEAAREQKPLPIEPSPFDLPLQLPAASGEADRSTTETSALPHLIVPVQGVDRKSIIDTFADTRDGYRHEALDIPASRGTPVLAAAEGNVVKLFTSQAGGLTVYQFDDSGTYCYYYAHLDRYAPELRESVLLRQGQVLGFVGATGNASAAAPHLHFAVFRLGPEKSWWKGTTPIDPLPLMQ
jgi:peptidoglycan LD-endopeptidase LytH